MMPKGMGLLASEMVAERMSFSVNGKVRFTQERLDALTA
jgi:hypothetical protein